MYNFWYLISNVCISRYQILRGTNIVLLIYYFNQRCTCNGKWWITCGPTSELQNEVSPNFGIIFPARGILETRWRDIGQDTFRNGLMVHGKSGVGAEVGQKYKQKYKQNTFNISKTHCRDYLSKTSNKKLWSQGDKYNIGIWF